MNITPNNWSRTLLMGVALLTTQVCWSQQKSGLQCGSFLQPEHRAQRTIAPADAEIVDQFGNSYTRESLMVPADKLQESLGNPDNCGLTVFRLCFYGFTTAEEATICNVFRYLENYVGLCPGGARPLIVVSKTAFGAGNDLPSTAGGVGRVYFLQECGVTNPLTFQVMNSGVNWPTEAATAELYINSAVTWHTLSQDPTMASGSYDLFSVALHEALHILGFASRIGNNPQGTTPTSFSTWDTQITGGSNHDPVLIADPHAPHGCCDLLMYNPVFDPITGGYPSGLFDYCNSNLQMGSSGAQINNYLYTTGDYDPDAVNNYFSHLDLCGLDGDQYVMYASIDPEVQRRIMRTEEIAILGLLGYCGPDFKPCNVIANDDFITLNAGSGAQNFSFATFAANDQHTQDYQITIDQDCGTAFSVGIINPFFLNQHILRVNPDFATPGTYTVCYTLVDCMGKCDDGIIYIQIVVPNYPPLGPCAPASCGNGQNLYCHGTFEEMLPITQSGQGQVGFPDCILDNTVDVLYQTNTGDIRLYIHGPTEALTVPLSSPVQPGCSISISFDAASNSQSMDAFIDLLAGHDLPCVSGAPHNCADPGDYDCLQNDLSIPNNAIGFVSAVMCDDPVFQNEYPNCSGEYYLTITNNLVLTHYGPFTFTNNSNESWNYVMLSNINTGSIGIHLDNLVITCECPGDNCVCILPEQALPDSVCQGEVMSIPVQVCLKGQSGTSDVHIEAVIPNIPGLYIVPGSDFDGGLDIDDLAVGTCEQYTLQVYVGYTVPVNTVLNFSFTIDATGASACSDSMCLGSFQVRVVNCDDDTTTTTTCVDPPEWHLECHGESNYFCIKDAQGGSPYLTWIEPAFTNVHGHCQSLTGLTPGQTLHFIIHVFEEGIPLYDCEIITTLDCHFIGDGGGKGFGQGHPDALTKIPDNAGARIIPNPSTGVFGLNLISGSAGTHRFELMDVGGRICRTWQRDVSEGPNKLEFSAGDLTPGFYQMNWKNAEGARLGVMKVLIQGSRQ